MKQVLAILLVALIGVAVLPMLESALHHGPGVQAMSLFFKEEPPPPALAPKPKIAIVTPAPVPKPPVAVPTSSVPPPTAGQISPATGPSPIPTPVVGGPAPVIKPVPSGTAGPTPALPGAPVPVTFPLPPTAPAQVPGAAPVVGVSAPLSAPSPLPNGKDGADATAKLLAEGYSYDPKSRRDPFQSMVKLLKYNLSKGELPPLQRVEISDVKLIGIVSDASGYYGLIQTPDGKGYTVRVGTLMGTNNGTIKTISEQRMIVAEPTLDIAGRMTTREIEILQRPKEGAE